MVIKSKEQSVDSTKTLGTLSGVFTPNILTILGVIMYLRLGWVVGNAGLINTVLILLVAQSITFLTGLSLSSICTNMKIKAGGAYYIISRSLGIEVGGAIGLPLYLSQTFGIGMYIVGFAETLTLFVPGINLSYVGLAALAVLSLMAIISSKLVEKTQYIIMGIIVLSLISFFLGAKPDISNIVLYPEYIRGNGFWFLFAVFFPAVTGMEAGLSMSGDLKDPAKSLPQGTLLAIATG
ncbi:MAG: Na-K-Cl cotransporter, partial [Candidatus Margulisbacteria bacterium]|nr:Na-K-Cl cotransporter [Candidatus Margulisiibacteriota bacterium]